MSEDFSIADAWGREILDSRGNPTISVTVLLRNGVTGTADVPSGASTGTLEAVELRDGDDRRFSGKGVLKAIDNVAREIAPAINGSDVRDQKALDQSMIELDGTPQKSRLGGNAILGVSMAAARAAAAAEGRPLYEEIGGRDATLLPMPCMNVLNGGAHADSSLDFQEFMIVPVGAPTFAEAMRYGAETYAAIRSLLKKMGLKTSVGDEGGFAPIFERLPIEAACDLIVDAVRHAGYEPGRDVAIALDPAASSFGSDGRYDLKHAQYHDVNRAGLLEIYEGLISKYPIVSIEDGFEESDWAGFVDQTEKEGDRIQIVGDDILVTNPKIIAQAIEKKAGNAALIKLNQIGTVSEAREAVELCHRNGWGTMVSHRSGETIDSFIADFAVAVGAGQIKSGAPCRGERLAKYNRLMEIEMELGGRARFLNPFARA